MKMTFINGRIVTPEALLEKGRMVVEDGKIKEVLPEDGSPVEGTVRDVSGCYLLPGFIDIHSDMIEGLLQPRSTAMMDFEMGLMEAEKQLAACGITTIFHSVSMFREGSWDAREIRTAPRVRELAELIFNRKEKPGLIHNRYHLRYELDNLECFDIVKQLIDEGKVQLLSLMDHRPGQGQYRDLKVYRRHLPSEGKNLSDGEFADLVKREQEKPMIEGDELRELVLYARERGIPIASHDDDSVKRIEENKELGAAISEFPISLDVAKAAREKGIAVLLGAPNILLGGSHSGNLSAEEAVREGCGDILCSDYYPQALLRAVFTLADKGALPLWEACRLVSQNPAEAVGLCEMTGSLEAGKTADFLIVSRRDGETPVLTETWVSGRPVMRMDYRRDRLERADWPEEEDCLERADWPEKEDQLERGTVGERSGGWSLY